MRNRALPLSLLLVLMLALITLIGACTQKAPTPAPTPAPVPAPTPAPAPAEVIKLKFGSIYSAPHPEAAGDLAWIDKIKKETNGRVDIEYFPGATVVSTLNCFAELQSGVVDISYINPNPQSPGFNIQRNATTWLYGVSSYADRMRIFQEVCTKYPEVPGEYSKAKVLAMSPGSNYQLILKKPVRTIEDMKGVQVRAMGAHGDWFKEMGGAGVAMPMGETYLALQKGTVDGAMAPLETLKTFKFGEVAKYITMLNVTSTPYLTRAINWETWNKLPADIQKIFDANFEFWTLEIGKKFDDNDANGVNAGKEVGVEFITPTAAEADKFFAALKVVCAKTATELDGKGYKGTEIFNYMRSVADKYNK